MFAPHLYQGKQLALVGVSFSSETRTIGDSWTGELLDEDGKKLRGWELKYQYKVITL